MSSRRRGVAVMTLAALVLPVGAADTATAAPQQEPAATTETQEIVFTTSDGVELRASSPG